jgi:P4 family phage/plasmid primase-like protien
LPHGKKDPVADGFTGVNGKYVDAKQLDTWLGRRGRAKAGNLNYPPGNIALRLPKTVLGIDVDAYAGKAGAETLGAAEETWGQLPPTWVSTSRTDGISGIRLYTVPEGLAWPGKLPQGGGVELLRWDHRYAIVAPSTNPINDDAVYAWYREEDGADGRVFVAAVDEIPGVAELPALPEEWVAGLTSGVEWRARAVDEEMTAVELNRWLAERPDPDAQCGTMRATVTKYSNAIRRATDDGGVHDAGRDGAWAVLGDSKAGHCGVISALAELKNVFIAAVRGRRADEGAERAEWARIVLRGGKKVTADDNPEVEEDPCGSLKSLRPKRADGRLGSADVEWRFDDVGNGNRLVRVMDDRARWVPGLDKWMLWKDGAPAWKPDADGQVMRWAVKAVNQMEDELAFLDGEQAEDILKAFKAHKKASGALGRLRAMVDIIKDRKGIVVSAETFDANPHLFGVANGTLELGADGVSFRGSRREDYLTLATATRYVSGARSALWEGFLKLVQPDEDVRAWLQKLVGYSLLGHNAERLLVALVGPTSTGKTTFAAAVQSALGPYAGPMPMSVFRDNPDDKPRPDLLDALPRRFVVAEEMSAAVHLHSDQIKRLTGGSSVVAVRGMRANTYVNRVPAMTPWLVSNSPPSVNGTDTALWRRLLAVPFETRIAEERAAFAEQLRAEAGEAILAWAVDGYAAYVDDVRRGNKLVDIPEAALETNATFREGLSDIDVFLREMTEPGAEYTVNRTQLYEEYVAWCERNGMKPATSVLLGRELAGRGYGVRSARVDGVPRHVRTGLRLAREGGKLER